MVYDLTKCPRTDDNIKVVSIYLVKISSILRHLVNCSQVYKTISRIDYIIIQNPLVMQNSEIGFFPGFLFVFLNDFLKFGPGEFIGFSIGA